MRLFPLALLAAGCAPGPLRAEAVRSEVIPTVATVTVHLDGRAEAVWVEHGPDEDLGQVARVVDGQALLVGAAPGQTWHWRAVAEVDGERVDSGPATYRAGSGPAGFPDLVAEGGGAGWGVTTLMGDVTGAVIVDRQGRYVWWHRLPEAAALAGRARLSRDGRGVWLNTRVLGGSQAELVWVSLDGTREERIAVPDSHHDFFELADGTLAWLEVDPVEIDGQVVEGDRVVERAPDGTLSTVYSVWDDADYDPEADVIPGLGWSHANALRYDQAEERLLLSFMGLNTIMEVDRASGASRWSLGGLYTDFVDGEGELVSRPHQPSWVGEDRVLWFDNGPRNRDDSRVLEYALDLDSGTATAVWSHSAEPPAYCYAMGDAQRLEDGNTLVDWSPLGVIEEVEPSGEVVWRLEAESGAMFGFLTWVGSL